MDFGLYCAMSVPCCLKAIAVDSIRAELGHRFNDFRRFIAFALRKSECGLWTVVMREQAPDSEKPCAVNERHYIVVIVESN